MDTPSSSFFRFRIGTCLLMIFSFAIGLSVRNIADGLHPLAMSLLLPKSTTPLRPGDVLRVEFKHLPSFDREVTVLADLTISMPQVGELSVDGQTVSMLEQTLRKKYRPYYLKGPAIASTIQVYRASSSVPLK